MKNTTQYKNLYQMLDQCTYILSNNVEYKEECNEALYTKLQEINQEEIQECKIEELEQYFTIQENDNELPDLIKNFKGKKVCELYEEMSDYLIDEIDGLTNDMDYGEIYQTFHVDGNTAEILEDYNQIVWYNEDMDAYFWGVTHFGTSWSYIMDSNYPIHNKTRYEINL